MTGEPEGAPPPRTSGKAVWSLVLGLLSFCGLFLTGLPAVVLGLLGMRDIRRSDGRLRGTGLAVGGLITGLGGCLLGLLVAVFGAWVGFQVKGELDNADNLKRIGKAMQDYHDTMGTYPPQTHTDKPAPLAGRPCLSWRVLLLPYLEEEKLFKQFKLDEPWDGPTNKPLLGRMPKVYSHPGMSAGDPTLTYYQVFVSEGRQMGLPPRGRWPLPALFERTNATRISMMPDGAANTILVAEAARP